MWVPRSNAFLGFVDHIVMLIHFNEHLHSRSVAANAVPYGA